METLSTNMSSGSFIDSSKMSSPASTPRGVKRLDFRRFLDVDDAYGARKRTLSNGNVTETESVQFTPFAHKKILSTG